MSIDVKAIIARGYLAAMKGDDERDFGLSEADVRMLHARQKKERERWNKMARHVVCIAADHVRRHRFSLFRQTALSPQTETFLKIIRGDLLSEQPMPKSKRLRELLQTSLLIRTPRTGRPH